MRGTTKKATLKPHQSTNPMKKQILSLSGRVLFEYDCKTTKELVEQAVKSGANLSGANLFGAYLFGADLSGADLSGAKEADLVIAQTRILPEGDIIGYKKCRNDVVVKLLIPKEAKRSSAFGRKCRAEYAQVLEIYGASEAISKEKADFIYRVGETVKPDKWDDNWMEECSHGIHFFITKIEAENY